jgi:SAM-dependent methyltransferase
LNTKLVPAPVLDVLKRHRRAYQAARKVRMGLGRVVRPRRFDEIPGRVHFNDFMLEEDTPEGVAQYRERALNVLRNVDATLAEAGREFGEVRSWLDFGSGYGRVVRFLVQRTPPETVWASDVIEEAVEFCKDEFGVHPLHSSASIADLELPRFDFVYAISVITHLDEANSRELLARLPEWLEPGGIVMFTTHGRWSLDNLGFYSDVYEQMRPTIERDVRERGLAFVPYHHYAGDDYGMTWHSADHVKETMRELHGDAMRLVRFEPQGLDEHQDVFAYQRVA